MRSAISIVSTTSMAVCLVTVFCWIESYRRPRLVFSIPRLRKAAGNGRRHKGMSRVSASMHPSRSRHWHQRRRKVLSISSLAKLTASVPGPSCTARAAASSSDFMTPTEASFSRVRPAPDSNWQGCRTKFFFVYPCAAACRCSSACTVTGLPADKRASVFVQSAGTICGRVRFGARSAERLLRYAGLPHNQPLQWTGPGGCRCCRPEAGSRRPGH